MSYITQLRQSSEHTGNCVCMGLDVQLTLLPHHSGDLTKDITHFYEELFSEMVKEDLIPSAFKPNIGYFHALDKPTEYTFSGSIALAKTLELLKTYFSSIPIILDSKRGDIARSSENYATEAFKIWGSDAVTVSPYMGSDSIHPFGNDKGVYVLTKTSNPGSNDLQNILTQEHKPFFMETAKMIVSYSKTMKGIGSVVGATHIKELQMIASFFAPHDIPLLIPGVGSQGGDAKSIIQTLKDLNYDLRLVRINSSSALTHPWKNSPPPKNWKEVCISSIRSLISECSL